MMNNEVEETWESEVIHHMKKQRFYAYIWAAVFSTTTALAVGALFALMPLKELVPMVIEVERSTGQIHIKTDLVESIEEVEEKNAIIESMIAKYIIAYKTYEYTDNRERQNVVKMMSTPSTYQEYEAMWRSKDKKVNPKLKYGEKDRAEVEIVSIAQLNETTHQVRFTVKEKYFGSTAYSYEHFVAIVKHELTPSGMTQADRWKNPIGFLISSIRFDDEYLD